MAKKEIPEKDKPIQQRWQDYGMAYLKFLINFIIWVLIGGMALWALQNKTSENSMPFNLTKLPYENSGKTAASSQINSFSDVPLFSYKPPVGFPYNFKDTEETTWLQGFGNWFSRTEAGSWGFGRRILFEIGRLVSMGFLVLSKIPKIPGITMDYYNIAELVSIFLLPFVVIFGITFLQPVATTVNTLIASFYDNSWFWGIIGLFFPVWIMNFFNLFLQNIYLGIFLFWMPLFSGGFNSLRKTVFKNKMIFLWILLIAAVVISSSYLPTQVTVGMALGLVMLLAWHYFFGPITSQALSKVVKSTQSTSDTTNSNNNNSNKGVNSSNKKSNNSAASGNNTSTSNNSASSNNSSSGNNSSSSVTKSKRSKKGGISTQNIPADAIGKIFENLSK
tara:strand:+ start:1872 stop:3044 length:1173 start_codon:yes stop_codon:yes gene_type:complete